MSNTAKSATPRDFYLEPLDNGETLVHHVEPRYKAPEQIIHVREVLEIADSAASLGDAERAYFGKLYTQEAEVPQAEIAAFRAGLEAKFSDDSFDARAARDEAESRIFNQGHIYTFVDGARWQHAQSRLSQAEATSTQTFAEFRSHANAEIESLTKERDLARDIVHDMFCQACGDYDKSAKKYSFDHMCLSTYEDAQARLVEWSMISEDQCRRK